MKSNAVVVKSISRNSHPYKTELGYSIDKESVPIITDRKTYRLVRSCMAYLPIMYRRT